MNQIVQTSRPADTIEVVPSLDAAYLRDLIRDPEIYDKVADDHSPCRETFPDLNFLLNMPGYLLLKVLRANVAVGVFLLEPVVDKVWAVHTVLTRECRGRNAWTAGRAGIQYMFEKTDAARLTSRCPEDNKQSLLFALATGFRIVERKLDWLKHGKLLTSTHVEMTRDMWKGIVCP